MLTAIDHVVLVVSDLDAAVSGLRDAGFHVVPGGEHPVGTANALVPFQDGTYIEVIGFRRSNASHRWWNLLQRGGGLVDVCARTSDISVDVAAFRKAGIAYSDARALGRTRPDGFELQFNVANPENDVGVVAFMVEDVTARSERVPAGAIHDNGAIGLERVRIAVDDAGRLARGYAGTLESPGEAASCPELNGSGLSFRVGACTLEYLEPGAGEGPLSGWLARRGPSPYGVVLRSSGAAETITPEHTNGARLWLVPGTA